MGRWIILSLVCGVIVLGGCGGKPRKLSPEKQARLNEARWKKAQAANQERLKESPANKKGMLYPVKVAFVWPVWLYDYSQGRTPGRAARQMHDRDSADARRTGIYYLSAREFGRQDPYVKRYSQIAADDPAPTVRAAAVRALNRSRAGEHTALYIRLLSDSSELVRLEAAKALANMPDENAIQPLLRVLADTEENVDVRVAAADALRGFNRPQVTQALVRTLSDRNFAIAWQSHESLWFITGKDFGYDAVAWLGYLTE